MKNKILIFGNGQIGNFYKKFFDSKNIEAEISSADIRNPDDVNKTVTNIQPTIIINTAAQTNLEWCETNKVEAFESNVLGAGNLAEVCDKNGIYFIHFSSGCIFESANKDDKKKETDIPHPAAFYSGTKVWSEHMVQYKRSKEFKYIILRPRQPISSQFNYKNTLVKLLTFSKFIDTPNTVTVLEDLMDWTLKIIDVQPIGILNAANDGYTTPYQEALLLKKHILPSLEIEKISKEQLDEITPNRRVDTILDVTKLEELVGYSTDITNRLEQLIIDLGKNLKAMTRQEIQVQLEKTLEQSRARTVVNNHWQELVELGS